MLPNAIFIDIDKTLTTFKNSKKVSDVNILALQKLQKLGVYVILSTGRDLTSALIIHSQIKYNEFSKYIIHSNGSTLTNVFENYDYFDEVIEDNEFKKLLDYLKMKKY